MSEHAGKVAWNADIQAHCRLHSADCPEGSPELLGWFASLCASSAKSDLYVIGQNWSLGWHSATPELDATPCWWDWGCHIIYSFINVAFDSMHTLRLCFLSFRNVQPEDFWLTTYIFFTTHGNVENLRQARPSVTFGHENPCQISWNQNKWRTSFLHVTKFKKDQTFFFCRMPKH